MIKHEIPRGQEIKSELMNLSMNSSEYEIIQGGKGEPNFLHSCPHSRQFSLPFQILLIKQRLHLPRGTIQTFYLPNCPCYHSQFEHYLVYILAVKYN